MNDPNLNLLLWLITASSRTERSRKKQGAPGLFAPLCVFAWACSSGSCSVFNCPRRGLARFRHVPASIHESFTWCTVSFHHLTCPSEEVWTFTPRDLVQQTTEDTHTHACQQSCPTKALMKCLKNWLDSFFLNTWQEKKMLMFWERIHVNQIGFNFPVTIWNSVLSGAVEVHVSIQNLRRIRLLFRRTLFFNRFYFETWENPDYFFLNKICLLTNVIIFVYVTFVGI